MLLSTFAKNNELVNNENAFFPFPYLLLHQVFTINNFSSSNHFTSLSFFIVKAYHHYQHNFEFYQNIFHIVTCSLFLLLSQPNHSYHLHVHLVSDAYLSHIFFSSSSVFLLSSTSSSASRTFSPNPWISSGTAASSTAALRSARRGSPRSRRTRRPRRRPT